MIYQRVRSFIPQLLLAAAMIFTGVRLVQVVTGVRQQDFRTYYAASVANSHGLDAYRLSALQAVSNDRAVEYPYVYPPFVLDLFRPFAALDLQQAYAVFLLLKLIAVTFLVRIWLKFLHLDAQQATLFLISILLGYRCTLYRDVWAGNVSTFEQLFLWWGIVLAMRGLVGRGEVLIAASAMFKLATLALTPLLVVIRRGRRSYFIVAGVLAVCATLLAWNVMLHPDQWQSFLTAARTLDERGIQCPSVLAQIRDLADAMGLTSAVATGVYAVWVCLVVATVLWAYRRTRSMSNVIPMVYVVILAYAIAVPRMKDYSYILLLVPTFHVLMSTVQNRWFLAFLFVAYWVPVADYQPLWLAITTFILLLRWIASQHNAQTAELRCTGQLPIIGSVDYPPTVSHFHSRGWQGLVR